MHNTGTHTCIYTNTQIKGVDTPPFPFFPGTCDDTCWRPLIQAIVANHFHWDLKIF